MEEYFVSTESLTDEERELIASVALSPEAQAEWDVLKQEAQSNGGDSSAPQHA